MKGDNLELEHNSLKYDQDVLIWFVGENILKLVSSFMQVRVIEDEPK